MRHESPAAQANCHTALQRRHSCCSHACMHIPQPCPSASTVTQVLFSPPTLTCRSTHAPGSSALLLLAMPCRSCSAAREGGSAPRVGPTPPRVCAFMASAARALTTLPPLSLSLRFDEEVAWSMAEPSSLWAGEGIASSSVTAHKGTVKACHAGCKQRSKHGCLCLRLHRTQPSFFTCRERVL